MIEASYGSYTGFGVRFVMPDSSVKSYSFEELEYPYFYAQNDLTGAIGVVSCEPVRINILHKNEIEKDVPMFKVNVRNPSFISNFTRKFKQDEQVYDAGVCVENDVRYLEQRLGADKVIRWTPPEKVLAVDIEVDKEDNVFLTGAKLITKDKETGESKVSEFLAFYRLEDLIDWMENNKVRFLAAYNGDGYDFRYMVEKLKDKPHFKFLETCVFLDILPIYCKLLHKSPAPLSQVAVMEGFENKLTISYSDMSMDNIDEVKVYNERDVDILVRLIIERSLIDGLFTLSQETGVVIFGRNGFFISQIVELENYIMMHRDEYKVWLERRKKPDSLEEYEGAVIVVPEIGVYKDVAVVDYTSLYPNSIINSEYNGDGKAVFGLLKLLLASFLNNKKHFKQLYGKEKKYSFKLLYDVYKILANGSYGAVGSVYFRYYSVEMAGFVTATGRQKREELKKYIEEKYGAKERYGDTDSTFFQVESYEMAEKIVEDVNIEKAPYEVTLDAYYVKIAFFGGKKGAVMKKYVGLKKDGSLVIKGLEAIRKEWCEYVRKFQKEVFAMLFEGEKPDREKFEEIYAKYYDDIETRKVDISDLLIIKSVKTEKEYKVKAPHVRAYQMLIDDGGESKKLIPFVSYLIIKQDRIQDVLPVGYSKFNELVKYIDWDYYKKKQLKAVHDRMASVFENR